MKYEDEDMIIKLHNLARKLNNPELRKIADRLSELSKKERKK